MKYAAYATAAMTVGNVNHIRVFPFVVEAGSQYEASGIAKAVCDRMYPGWPTKDSGVSTEEVDPEKVKPAPPPLTT